MKKLLKGLITSHQGEVSSKIVIGTISYLVLLATIITVIFINPDFPGLEDLITVLIITSASLLGLTTVENISGSKKKKDDEEDF